jgi:hypothetical protein
MNDFVLPDEPRRCTPWTAARSDPPACFAIGARNALHASHRIEAPHRIGTGLAHVDHCFLAKLGTTAGR